MNKNSNENNSANINEYIKFKPIEGKKATVLCGNLNEYIYEVKFQLEDGSIVYVFGDKIAGVWYRLSTESIIDRMASGMTDDILDPMEKIEDKNKIKESEYYPLYEFFNLFIEGKV